MSLFPKSLVLASAAAFALSLSGCGSSTPDSASDPAASPSVNTGSVVNEPTGTAQDSTPTPDTGEVPFTEVGVFTRSDEGGSVAAIATPLGSRKALNDYVGQFKGTALADDLRKAVAGVSGTPYVQVVAVGCERPTSIRVLSGAGGYTIEATVPTSNKQCLVAETSVAVVTVP